MLASRVSDLVQIRVQMQLQQAARIEPRSSVSGRFCSLEAQLRYLQTIDDARRSHDTDDPLEPDSSKTTGTVLDYEM
jgi:hypothetical protein